MAMGDAPAASLGAVVAFICPDKHGAVLGDCIDLVHTGPQSSHKRRLMSSERHGPRSSRQSVFVMLKLDSFLGFAFWPNGEHDARRKIARRRE